MLLVATSDGLLVMQRAAGRWTEKRRGLRGRRVTSVIAREGVILAGTDDGVWRSDDLGESWDEASQGLASGHVRWLAYHPDLSDFELVGTEPAGIFVSRDGGDSWQACLEVAALRDRHGWFLPYSPEAGCVRGFAHQGDRAYAAVEVGGVLRADDGGRSWRLVAGSDGNPHVWSPAAGHVHPDVHSVHVSPADPDVVIAATGGGLYRSADGGSTWSCLYTCYCRAAWLDPEDPDHLVFGPAESVDRQGRLLETRDSGQSWQEASEGLGTPWPRHMVERLAEVDAWLLAVLSNGELWVCRTDRLAWQPLPIAGGRVAAVTGW